MSDKSSWPIGIFDSGVGGLTVLKELEELLPNENFIYFGDTARVPYGNKSRETIIKYAIENTIYLMNQKIKLLVVACNTASAFAINSLTSLFSVPIVNVIEPCVEMALKLTKTKSIAILGTRGTIESKIYQKEFKKKDKSVQVQAIACPLFVPIVEEQFFNHPSTELIIQEYLLPLKDSSIDTLLLGCTHYPFLKRQINNCIGNDTQIIDSGYSCAQEVKKRLEDCNLVNKKLQNKIRRFCVSDDPEKFSILSKLLLKKQIDRVELVRW
ncbi:Glutamate racemase 1 [Candidatus Rubidus massiliensis]|nr:Glutamate racemase 1 [Candidatus Rubidus massiliensis]